MDIFIVVGRSGSLSHPHSHSHHTKETTSATLSVDNSASVSHGDGSDDIDNKDTAAMYDSTPNDSHHNRMHEHDNQQQQVVKKDSFVEDEDLTDDYNDDDDDHIVVEEEIVYEEVVYSEHDIDDDEDYIIEEEIVEGEEEEEGEEQVVSVVDNVAYDDEVGQDVISIDVPMLSDDSVALTSSQETSYVDDDSSAPPDSFGFDDDDDDDSDDDVVGENGCAVGNPNPDKIKKPRKTKSERERKRQEFETYQAAIDEGARKAMLEEMAREEALLRKKSEVESERLQLEERHRQLQETARTMLSTMLSPTADLLRSPDRNVDEWTRAKSRLSEKIRSVNQAISTHATHGSALSPLPLDSSPNAVSKHLSSPEADGSSVDKKKQALFELKRKAAREQLHRNNQVLKERLRSPVRLNQKDKAPLPTEENTTDDHAVESVPTIPFQFNDANDDGNEESHRESLQSSRRRQHQSKSVSPRSGKKKKYPVTTVKKPAVEKPDNHYDEGNPKDDKKHDSSSTVMSLDNFLVSMPLLPSPKKKKTSVISQSDVSKTSRTIASTVYDSPMLSPDEGRKTYVSTVVGMTSKVLPLSTELSERSLYHASHSDSPSNSSSRNRHRNERPDDDHSSRTKATPVGSTKDVSSPISTTSRKSLSATELSASSPRLMTSRKFPPPPKLRSPKSPKKEKINSVKSPTKSLKPPKNEKTKGSNAPPPPRITSKAPSSKKKSANETSQQSPTTDLSSSRTETRITILSPEKKASRSFISPSEIPSVSVSSRKEELASPSSQSSRKSIASPRSPLRRSLIKIFQRPSNGGKTEEKKPPATTLLSPEKSTPTSSPVKKSKSKRPIDDSKKVASTESPTQSETSTACGQYYSMVELQQSKIKGIDISRREEYLSPDEFDHVFGMSKELFATLPKWKRERAKRAAKLF